MNLETALNLLIYIAMPFVIGCIITIYTDSNHWYYSKLRLWFTHKRKYYRNYSFKKKFLYNYSNKPTIAARRLIKGYFKHQQYHQGPYNPFNYIRSVGAKVKRNELIINIVTDRPGLFIGKGGKSFDSITAYILNSHYYINNKFYKLNIILEESQYWPETYEEIEEYDKEYARQYFEDINNL